MPGQTVAMPLSMSYCEPPSLSLPRDDPASCATDSSPDICLMLLNMAHQPEQVGNPRCLLVPVCSCRLESHRLQRSACSSRPAFCFFSTACKNHSITCFQFPKKREGGRLSSVVCEVQRRGRAVRAGGKAGGTGAHKCGKQGKAAPLALHQKIVLGMSCGVKQNKG